MGLKVVKSCSWGGTSYFRSDTFAKGRII